MAIKDLTHIGFYIQTKHLSSHQLLCGLIDLSSTNVSEGEVKVLAAANVKKTLAHTETLNVAASDGWGPTLYLAMIEEFGRLMPCSEKGKVSERASSVWKQFEADKLILNEKYSGFHADAHLNKIYSVKKKRLNLDAAKNRIQDIIKVKPNKKFLRKVSEQEINDARNTSDYLEGILLSFVREKAKVSTELYINPR